MSSEEALDYLRERQRLAEERGIPLPAFLASVIGYLERGHELTERQEQAVLRMRDGTSEMSQLIDGATSPAPIGDDTTITGTVAWVKWKDTGYGPRQRMLVVTDGGWKACGTVPHAIADVRAGERITLRAKTREHETDPAFAWYSYPKEACHLAGQRGDE